MKRILSILFVFITLQTFAQDSTRPGFLTDRRLSGYKDSNVPSYLIDGTRAFIIGSDTFRVNSNGDIFASSIGVYADANAADRLQAGLDKAYVQRLLFQYDTVKKVTLTENINAHWKTVKFANGASWGGSVTVDSLVVDAGDYDRIFDTTLTFTNFRSAKNYVTPQMFGAKGDGVTDDTRAIRAAFRVPNVEVRFPVGTYYTTDSLKLDWSSSISMPDGSLILSNTTDRPAIIIGSYDKSVLTDMRNKHYSIRVQRYTQSDWTDTLSIGVKMVNLNYSKVDYVSASSFTVGAKTLGYNAGFAYVDFNLGLFDKNGIHFHIATMSPSALAWNNQNNYSGGWFRNGSENSGKQVIGVLIGNGDYAVTNNIFTGQSFEMNRSNAIPFYVKSGSRNKGLFYRSEGNSDTAAYVAYAASNGTNIRNEFIAGRDGGTGKLYDYSLNGANDYQSADRLHINKSNYTVVYSVDDFASMCSYSGTDSSLSISYPGLFVKRTGSDAVYPSNTLSKANGAQLIGNYLQMDSDHQFAVSTDLIDVSTIKRYIIKAGVEAGSSGAAIYLVLLNGNGVNITSTTTVQSPLSFTYTSTYGGSMYTSNSGARDVSVTFPDTVKYARIMAGRTSGTVKLKSLRVVSYGEETASNVWRKFVANEYNTSPSKPSIGSYIQGKIILNSSPTKDSAYGWVCTKSGSFGSLASVTGSISSSSAKLVLNSGSGSKLQVGDWLMIGSKRLQVLTIDADTAYLNGLASSTLSGASISYATPEFETISYVGATGGADLTAVEDTLDSHAVRLDSLEANDTLHISFAKNSTRDSIILTIEGTRLAVKDSVGSGGSGSGTVNSSTASYLSWYASSGTAVSGNSSLTWDGTTFNVASRFRANNSSIFDSVLTVYGRASGMGVSQLSNTFGLRLEAGKNADGSSNEISPALTFKANRWTGSSTNEAVNFSMDAMPGSARNDSYYRIRTSYDNTSYSEQLKLYYDGRLELPSIPRSSKSWVLYYDSTTKQVSYAPAPSGGGGGSSSWGGITGTLSDQTDLQSALNAKMANPMTTSGDIIYGGSSGTPTRLAKGSNGTYLGVSSGSVGWISKDSVYLIRVSDSIYLTNGTDTSSGVYAGGGSSSISGVNRGVVFMDGTTPTANDSIKWTGGQLGILGNQSVEGILKIVNPSASINTQITNFGSATIARTLIRPGTGNKPAAVYISPNGTGSSGDVTAFLSMFATDYGASTLNPSFMQFQMGTTDLVTGVNMLSSGTGALRPFNVLIGGTQAVTVNTDRTVKFHNVGNGTGGTDSLLVISGGILKKIAANYYATSGGISDGDKGDITVASSGSSWTIDADAVTNAKLANMAANTIKGNNTGSSANPTDLSVSDVNTMLSLGSGSYTPTLSNTTNVDASTARACYWMRVGTTVTIGGTIEVDPTTSGVATSIQLTLPVSSTFTTFAGGGSGTVNNIYVPVYITPAVGASRINFAWIPTTNTNNVIQFSFTYNIE